MSTDGKKPHLLEIVVLATFLRQQTSDFSLVLDAAPFLGLCYRNAKIAQAQLLRKSL